MFASSKRRRSGATSSASPTSFNASGASSSLNAIAPTTEESTTLTFIPHLANHARGLGTRLQAERLSAFEDLADAELGGCGVLEDHEELSLERTVVPFRALANPIGDLVGHV